MKMLKIKEISVSHAVILSAVIISISIFITGWVFLGSNNSKTIKNQPVTNQKALTPEQIKKIQEDRAKQVQKVNPATTTGL